MDPARPVDPAKVDRILRAIQLTASSSGLQPFHVFAITNPDLRARIRPVAWDQAQITDGSHLLVFAARDNYTEARIDALVDQMAAERGGTAEAVTAYYDRLKSMYLPRDPAVNYEHAARQAYISLGTALIAAAEEGVDATPMEGFDPAAVDEILALRELGLRSVVLLPLGHRADQGDWLKDLRKVRRPLDGLVTRLD
ncbi:nitroreductase family protein [Paracoccus sp. p4-l81]|uniref:nitroreductase family protein n=1 Tax=Paracoccus sp. p4-l81 TaxID=3342806 RepID=UPI0035BAE569